MNFCRVSAVVSASFHHVGFTWMPVASSSINLLFPIEACQKIIPSLFYEILKLRKPFLEHVEWVLQVGHEWAIRNSRVSVAIHIADVQIIIHQNLQYSTVIGILYCKNDLESMRYVLSYGLWNWEKGMGYGIYRDMGYTCKPSRWMPKSWVITVTGYGLSERWVMKESTVVQRNWPKSKKNRPYLSFLDTWTLDIPFLTRTNESPLRDIFIIRINLARGYDNSEKILL